MVFSSALSTLSKQAENWEESKTTAHLKIYHKGPDRKQQTKEEEQPVLGPHYSQEIQNKKSKTDFHLKLNTVKRDK